MGPEKSRLDALRIDRSEVEETGSGRWPWVLVAALLVIDVLVAWWLLRPEVTPVRTAEARGVEGESGGETVLNASGYVTARRQATVSSKVTGKVIEVLIEEGMVVAEGQVLARLDPSNVQVSLRLVEAQLEAARKTLEETRVRMEEARLELSRARNLVAEKVASQADLDAAEAGFSSLQARLEKQRQDVEVAQREVDYWRQELEDRIIRAPFAGVVVAKNAQPGEMISPVSAGGGFTRTGIGTVVDMNSLEIEVDVNEAYINRVEAGQEVVATLDAYSDWEIPCHVIAIIPTADRQRATVQVRVGFDQLDPRILPDMGVKVAFQDSGEIGDTDRGVRVPAEALRRRDGRDVVLVVSDARIERRAVQVGSRNGGEATIIAGLREGERVVVVGPDELDEGDSVVEIEP